MYVLHAAGEGALCPTNPHALTDYWNEDWQVGWGADSEEMSKGGGPRTCSSLAERRPGPGLACRDVRQAMVGAKMWGREGIHASMDDAADGLVWTFLVHGTAALCGSIHIASTLKCPALRGSSDPCMEAAFCCNLAAEGRRPPGHRAVHHYWKAQARPCTCAEVWYIGGGGSFEVRAAVGLCQCEQGCASEPK